MPAAVPDVPAMRATPSRPALAVPRKAPNSTLFDGVHYVDSADIATFLGLKIEWLEPKRKLLLADTTTKLLLEADRVDVFVDGLRVHLGQFVLSRNGRLYVGKIDWERYLLPRLRPSLLGPPPRSPKVITIDPGHGGIDDGMENKALGVKEKTFALDVSLRLKKLLEADGYKVVLTRADDRQLGPDKATDWRKRADITNSAGSDLFLSIHFNSLYPDTKTSGTEVYTFTPQYQRSARSLSPGQVDDTEREAMAINRFDTWSALFAQSMSREVLAGLQTLDRGQKTMHSAVLRWLNCPAVLVEAVFLSNDAEAKRVLLSSYRQQIAESMRDGIRGYVAALDRLRGPEIKFPSTR